MTKAKRFNLTELLNQRSVEQPEEGEGRDTGGTERQKEEIVLVDVYDLEPSKENFYQVDDGLKRSVELVGILQPLLVKKPENGKYRIIAGHRRRLAVLALMEEGKEARRYVPCVFKKEDVRDRLAIILANRFRDKTDWEKMMEVVEAEGLARELKEDYQLGGRTREVLAEMMGMSQGQIGRYKAIYNHLDVGLMEEFREGTIGFSAVAELCGLPGESQRAAVKQVREKGGISLPEIRELKRMAVPQPGNGEEGMGDSGTEKRGMGQGEGMIKPEEPRAERQGLAGEEPEAKESERQEPEGQSSKRPEPEKQEPENQKSEKQEPEKKGLESQRSEKQEPEKREPGEKREDRQRDEKIRTLEQSGITDQTEKKAEVLTRQAAQEKIESRNQEFPDRKSRESLQKPEISDEKEPCRRTRPMTTKELFYEICEKLKEKGKLPDILDYALANGSPAPMETCEFNLKNNLDYGGNEGIYLDFQAERFPEGQRELKGLGTFKTLRRDEKAMHTMAALLADFIIEMHDYVNQNLDDFTWTGVDVRTLDASGNRLGWGYSCSTKEAALKRKDELLETYPCVVVRENASRKETVYSRNRREAQSKSSD